MRSFEISTKLIRAHIKKIYVNTNLEVVTEVFLKSYLNSQDDLEKEQS